MNFTRLLSFGFCLFAVLSSCREATPSAEHLTVISGHIDHPVSEHMILQGQNRTIEFTTNEGLFFQEINITEPAYFTLSHGTHHLQVYLAPEYHLHLSFDASASDLNASLQIQGRGVESNKYLQAQNTFTQQHQPEWSELLDSSEVFFLDQANRYRIKKEAFLQNYLAKNTNLDPKFIEKERSRIQYEFANQMFLLAEARPQKPIHLDFDALQDGFYTFLSNLSMEDADLLILPEYRLFLTQVVKRYASDLMFQDQGSYWKLVFELVDSEINDEQIRSVLAYELIKDHLRSGYNSESDALHESFRDLCKNGTLLAEIRSLYEYSRGLATGMPIPHIQLYDVHDNVWNLSDFAGGFVYLQFWQSMCEPCTKEQEALEDLRKHFSHIQVQFVSVNVDREHELWKQAVRSGLLGGIQLRAEADDFTALSDNFQLHKLPRYLLIDREGNVVEAFAPPPNRRDIKDWIDKHLGNS